MILFQLLDTPYNHSLRRLPKTFHHLSRLTTLPHQNPCFISFIFLLDLICHCIYRRKKKWLKWSENLIKDHWHLWADVASHKTGWILIRQNTKVTRHKVFICGEVNKLFILNRFFKSPFKGCQRWRTSYISRDRLRELKSFWPSVDKNRKLLNIKFCST